MAARRLVPSGDLDSGECDAQDRSWIPTIVVLPRDAVQAALSANPGCCEERYVTDTNHCTHVRIAMLQFKVVEHVVNSGDILVGDSIVHLGEDVCEAKREHRRLGLLGDGFVLGTPAMSWVGPIGFDVG